MKLSLGFSPCPNDAFIFYALVHGVVGEEGLEFEFVIEDVEALNKRALKNDLDITKLSFAAFPHVKNHYLLLDSGSALGNNCGPLLISKKTISDGEIPNLTVAVPGKYTTANFLLSHFYPSVKSKRELIFSQIETALVNEETDLGVIIHENRFTYEKKGLKKVSDLGERWEQETGLPIPLGGIAMKRSLPKDTIASVQRLIRRSVEYAFAHPGETMPFVRMHAQEMDEEVMWQHIRLYVNDYTLSLGEKGKASVRKFLSIALKK